MTGEKTYYIYNANSYDPEQTTRLIIKLTD